MTGDDPFRKRFLEVFNGIVLVERAEGWRDLQWTLTDPTNRVPAGAVSFDNNEPPLRRRGSTSSLVALDGANVSGIPTQMRARPSSTLLCIARPHGLQF